MIARDSIVYVAHDPVCGFWAVRSAKHYGIIQRFATEAEAQRVKREMDDFAAGLYVHNHTGMAD